MTKKPENNVSLFQYYSSGSNYSGSFSHGERHGPGREDSPGGGVFEGQFRHNRRAGGRARVTYPGGAVRSVIG